MSQAEISLKLEQLTPTNEIGKARFKEKKHEESKVAYLQTEIITQEILEDKDIDLNDIKDEHLAEMIKCYCNLSLLFFKKRDFGAAEDYAQKAIDLCENANIKSEEKSGEYPLSLDLYEKSQRRFTEANWKRYAPKLNYSQVSYKQKGSKKVLQKPLITPKDLVLHQESKKGVGVLAGEDIEAGEPIAEFVGEILTTNDITKMNPEQAADDYRFEAVIPNKFAFNHIAFVNDGFPNTIVIRTLGTKNKYRFAAVALDDISTGQALAFDYRTHKVKTNFYQISPSSYEEIKLFFNQRPLEAEYESLFEVSSQQIFGDESNPAFRAFKIKQCLFELLSCLIAISKSPGENAKVVIPYLGNKEIDLTKEKDKKFWSTLGYFIKMDFVMNTPIVFTKLLLDGVFSVSQLHQYFAASGGNFHPDVKKFFNIDNYPIDSLSWGILKPIRTYPAEDKPALIYLRCKLIIPLLEKGYAKALCGITWCPLPEEEPSSEEEPSPKFTDILSFLVDQFKLHAKLKHVLEGSEGLSFKALETKNPFLSFNGFLEELVGNIKSAERGRDSSGGFTVELKPFYTYCNEKSGASDEEDFLCKLVRPD